MSATPVARPAGPAGRRPARKALLLGAAGVVLAGMGIAAWTLSADAEDTPDGHAAPPVATSAPSAVRPSPTVDCHSQSCASLDPAHTNCSEDAVTAYSGQKFGATIELRHSPACGTVWAKMSKTSPGDRVTVTHQDGHSEEYRQQYGRDAHTFMLVVDTPGKAEACAIVQGRGTVCATRHGGSSRADSDTGH
ncbi:DUF2690 domain-containing protein [Streptomyces sp. NPDC047737]|uniref:DUF2690 domain-containing protein n=1 Tax=Streptomyces sp. NPDC047737 TaxID=3155740 RepID=UPI0033D2879E